MIFLYTLTLLLTYIGYPLIKNFLIKQRLVEKNYLGDEIPFGYGLLLVINSMIIFMVGRWLNIYSARLSISFLFLLFVVGIVGLTDDYFGKQENRGFRGHVGTFFSKFEVTTGFLKVILISVAAFLVIVKFENNILLLSIDFLLLVLMTNFINLLDLRPGRALKGFLIMGLLSFLFVDSLFKKLIMPVLLMVLILMPVDLKGKAMLGDVGANLLGAFLGLSLVWTLEVAYKAMLVIVLIMIHIYTEKFSLTDFISQNRFLNYIDKLGRNET